ncbi:MAG: hypothetical protein WC788_07745 [Candidatus Paceibacterota bacterium]|jgi:hypothetical protein
MNKLYDSNGRIKVDNIKKALENAKYEGKLHNVPSFKIPYFIEALEEKIEQFKNRVGTQITEKEVEYLFKELFRDKSDKLLDSELREIENVLTDKDFDID